MIKLLVEGGNMKPGPSIAQKIGPLGINMGKVIDEVNKATQQFKGLKVPVELDVNTKTKDFEINVKSPPVSELIKKELGIEKGSGERKKLQVGNLAIEQVIKIAKTKQKDMLDKNLKAAVRSVVGSCVSLGVLIESNDPKKVEEQVLSGKYDKEIEQEKVEADEEKLDRLKQEFEKIKEKEEEIIRKEEEEEKAAEEAKKTEVEGEKEEAEEEEKLGKKKEKPEAEVETDEKKEKK